MNCPTVSPTPTKTCEFVCYRSKVCIKGSYVCDGYKDCPHGEDETCCRKDNFVCRESGKCISRSHLCDNSTDCPNGEDEKDCASTTKVCMLCVEVIPYVMYI